MKTVKIILLLGLLPFSSLTFAQNTPEKKNSWRTEAGVAYTGIGNGFTPQDLTLLLLLMT